MMSHMRATCVHGVTFQSYTVLTLYDYCVVQMLSGYLGYNNLLQIYFHLGFITT